MSTLVEIDIKRWRDFHVDSNCRLSQFLGANLDAKTIDVFLDDSNF